MELSLHGASGAVRLGYAEAAALGPWKLETIGPSLYRASATVMRATPAYLSMAPLVVRLQAGSVVYQWPVSSLGIDGSRIEVFVEGSPMLGAGGANGA
jgi:hypothetical protein